jgi:hypothetical protein
VDLVPFEEDASPFVGDVGSRTLAVTVAPGRQEPGLAVAVARTCSDVLADQAVARELSEPSTTSIGGAATFAAGTSRRAWKDQVRPLRVWPNDARLIGGG